MFVYLIVRGERGQGGTVLVARNKLRSARCFARQYFDQRELFMVKHTLRIKESRDLYLVEEWRCPMNVDFVRIERWRVR